MVNYSIVCLPSNFSCCLKLISLMENASSSTSECDYETRDLKSLLDVFSSSCTLKEISFAYCKAKRDVIVAGDLLYQIQENKSNGVCHPGNANNGLCELNGSSKEGKLKHSIHPEKDSMGVKPKKLTAAFGTVSSSLGRMYVQTPTSGKKAYETTKPLKLEISEHFLDELDEQSNISNSAEKNGILSNKDIEGFLFSMLGDGFKLSMGVIQEVLGCCGYNIKESMEELLTLSSKTLDKGKGVDYCVIRKCSNMEFGLSEEINPNSASTLRNSAGDFHKEENKSNLPKELLQSLFNVPDRSEEEPKHLEWGLNRRRVAGQQVVELPLDELSSTPDIPRKVLVEDDVRDELDDYQILRRAVKTHWDAMKDYYEAAVEAFTRGDSETANYLMEQGKYHIEKAREADEKSAKEIVEPKKANQDIINLDLQVHSNKESMDLLKLHLRSLANIPYFRCLNINVGSDAEDRKKVKRRRLVIKFLEKESVKWSEDDTEPGIIRIQLDQINPRELSFT